MKTIEDRIVGPDGLKIAVTVNEPVTEPIAAAIFCPGYLHSKGDPHIAALGRAAAEMGIIAAGFDPIGTWRSDGTVKEHYRLSRCVENIGTVRQHIAATYGVTETIVGGHSIGGLASMLYAAQAATRAVVAICAPKEMKGTADPTWRQTGFRTTTRPDPGGAGERTYRVPWAFVRDSRRYSAIDAVERRQQGAPLVLVAGTRDTVVPAAEVMEVYTAARRPAVYVGMAVGHNYHTDSGQVDVVTTEVMRWLRVILDAPAPQSS